MENLKGCLDCKHSSKGAFYLTCANKHILEHCEIYDSDSGEVTVELLLEYTKDTRAPTGKCKREAIYFEPTKYYQFKQWIKQQFNKLFNRA